MKTRIDTKLIDRLVESGKKLRHRLADPTLSLTAFEREPINELLATIRELAFIVDAAHDHVSATSDDSDDQPGNDDDNYSEEAAEQCDRILDLCEELPSRAEDFGLSIIDKVESIRDWIAANKHVTDAQQQALDNMEAGVRRWLD